MVQKQWRRWSDPFIEGSRQVLGDLLLDSIGDFGVHGPCLFRERRRTYVLWHAKVDEQHRSLPDIKKSEDSTGQSESVLEREWTTKTLDRKRKTTPGK